MYQPKISQEMEELLKNPHHAHVIIYWLSEEPCMMSHVWETALHQAEIKMRIQAFEPDDLIKKKFPPIKIREGIEAYCTNCYVKECDMAPGQINGASLLPSTIKNQRDARNALLEKPCSATVFKTILLSLANPTIPSCLNVLDAHLGSK